MRVVLVLLAIAVALGGGYYFLSSTPTMEFVLATTDGQGTLTYVCTTDKGGAAAADRAEAAHAYFQEQLAAVNAAAEKGMQEATDKAAAAGTTPDFTAVEEVRADLVAATVTVLQEMYGCTVTAPPLPE
jgi:hypothetical protein